MAALFGAAATAHAAGAADSSYVVTFVAGLRVGIWRVRLLGCASWKQFTRLQKAFCLGEKPCVKRAAHSPLPTRCQKKKQTHSLALLLQNHLDHFNTLLPDLWHRNIHDLLYLCTSTRAVACDFLPDL